MLLFDIHYFLKVLFEQKAEVYLERAHVGI